MSRVTQLLAEDTIQAHNKEIIKGPYNWWFVIEPPINWRIRLTKGKYFEKRFGVLASTWGLVNNP